MPQRDRRWRNLTFLTRLGLCDEVGLEELVDVFLSEEKLSAKPDMREFVIFKKFKKGRPTDLKILQEFGLRQ